MTEPMSKLLAPKGPYGEKPEGHVSSAASKVDELEEADFLYDLEVRKDRQCLVLCQSSFGLHDKGHDPVPVAELLESTQAPEIGIGASYQRTLDLNANPEALKLMFEFQEKLLATCREAGWKQIVMVCSDFAANIERLRLQYPKAARPDYLVYDSPVLDLAPYIDLTKGKFTLPRERWSVLPKKSFNIHPKILGAIVEGHQAPAPKGVPSTVLVNQKLLGAIDPNKVVQWAGARKLVVTDEQNSTRSIAEVVRCACNKLVAQN